MSFRITQSGRVGGLLVALSLASLACANSESIPDDEASGAGGSSDGGGGPTVSSTGSGGTGDDAGTSTGSSSASSGSGGGPLGTYGPDDMPPFTTAAELCAYVNEEREGYAAHERYRGPPWSGEYHQEVTWPLTLATDAALSSAATTLAESLAGGQSPPGAPYTDGSPGFHELLYVSGVSTASYTVASPEAAGDWTTDLAGNVYAGITSNNGTARMALFYQDPGSSGPMLSRIGCGGAATPTGQRWWVIQMAP